MKRLVTILFFLPLLLTGAFAQPTIPMPYGNGVSSCSYAINDNSNKGMYLVLSGANNSVVQQGGAAGNGHNVLLTIPENSGKWTIKAVLLSCTSGCGIANHAYAMLQSR